MSYQNEISGITIPNDTLQNPLDIRKEAIMAAEWVETDDFSNIFASNLALLTEVRDYLQTSVSAERVETENPVAKLTATREASRLTSMLAETMSWLLLNKAVNNNELTLEELLNETTSLCEQIGPNVNEPPVILADLPETLNTAFEKTIPLFAQIHGILDKVRTATN